MSTMSGNLGQRRCEICGKMFRPKQPHHRTCFDCAKGQFQGGPANHELQQRFTAYLKQVLEQGYFDQKGNLRPALRVEDAQLVANVLANAGVTGGQLRRFFTMARALEQRLDNSADFAVIAPDIARLQPLVAAIIGRTQSDAQRSKLGVLREFIDTNARKARDNERAFRKGFLPHFEGVIAYFTYLKPK
jgi:CRISPR type III-A-associated protein Csm2